MKQLITTALFISFFISLFLGCDNHQRQAYFKNYEETSLFSDQRSARRPPERSKTMAALQDPYNSATPNIVINKKFVKKGEKVYQQSCAVCHGLSGEGDGPATRKGLKGVESLLSEKTVNKTNSFYFKQLTNGGKKMPSYASRLTPKERWQAVSYLRFLQYAQRYPVSSLTSEEREKLDKMERPNE